MRWCQCCKSDQMDPIAPDLYDWICCGVTRLIGFARGLGIFSGFLGGLLGFIGV